MTTLEWERFLSQEKKKAEQIFGYDMCKKYARCLFCSDSDRYRCAGAHERLQAALAVGGLRLPSWLLPEPDPKSAEESHSHAAPVVAPSAEPRRSPFSSAKPTAATTPAAKPAPAVRPSTTATLTVRPMTATPTVRPTATSTTVRPSVSSVSSVRSVHTVHEEHEEETLETVSNILADFRPNSVTEERARELRKISAMMEADDSSDKMLSRIPKTNGENVPVFVIRKKSDTV